MISEALAECIEQRVYGRRIVEQIGNCANIDISNNEGQSIFEPHESAFKSIEVVNPDKKKKKRKV